MAAVEVAIVSATKEHARELAPRMRAAEVAEIRASGNLSPLGALLLGVEASRPAYTALFDGEVACMWGVVPLRTSALAGRVGAAWLLTSELVERHPVAFYRRCRPALALLFEVYDALVNAIDARHAQAVRWGRRLGFRLEDAAPFGAEALPFHRFRVSKEDVRV
jgi:hypothetical protein